MAIIMFRCVILISLLLTAMGVLAQEYDIEPDASGENLYFTDLAKLDRFDSVTVFITDGKMDKKIADSFWQFAKLIGKDNGATTVDIFNYKRYSEILARLNCRPIRTEDVPAVVFTAKNLRYCQVFPLNDPKAVSEVLITIERNMSCPSDLVVERVARDARGAVQGLAKSIPGTQGLQRPAGELIDFLAEQLRKTCKQKQG